MSEYRDRDKISSLKSLNLDISNLLENEDLSRDINNSSFMQDRKLNKTSASFAQTRGDGVQKVTLKNGAQSPKVLFHRIPTVGNFIRTDPNATLTHEVEEMPETPESTN